jgi:hypothetical protein
MSHPKNKLERFEIGITKSKRRVMLFLSFRDSLIDREFLDIWSRKFRNTTRKCSCSLCGNPRKYFNEGTLQEKKFDQTYPDE